MPICSVLRLLELIKAIYYVDKGGHEMNLFRGRDSVFTFSGAWVTRGSIFEWPASRSG